MYNTKSNKVKKNNILTFYFKQIAKEKICYNLMCSCDNLLHEGQSKVETGLKKSKFKGRGRKKEPVK